MDSDRVEAIPPEKAVSKSIEQAPVAALVDKLLAKAVESRASEIHIEPQADRLLVRVRIDGMMRQLSTPLPKSIAPELLDRLKTMANLDVSQSQPSQKGHCLKYFGDRQVDFCISTLPGHYGEKAFIRLTDCQSSCLSLADLIPEAATCHSIQQMLHRPSGLILLSAPVGSEGSATWYTLLGERASATLNISTLENPIQRVLPHVTQVEIDEAQGITYGALLQSFLHQDVDIIAVDRIPSPDVGKTLIEMALAGHLAIATLPVNNPITGIISLNKMGIDAALVAEATLGVINQRLLRQLCPVCRLPYTPSLEKLGQFGLDWHQGRAATFYRANSLTAAEREVAKAKGQLCHHCNGLGYRGQIGVYEVLKITPRLRTQIAQDVDAPTLQYAALQDGWETLLSYGLELVARGETTLEEIERVLPDYLPANLAVIPSAIEQSSGQFIQRLEEVEKLLIDLTQTVQQLKQDVAATASNSSPKPSVDPRIETTYFEAQTLIGTPPMYEELEDPGDWEQLRKELASNPPDMIIPDLEELEQSAPKRKIKNLPDPWNH